MTPLTVTAEQVAPQPWRNGGGLTRELLAWPSAADWRLRITLAEVRQDGPFSPFPGVQRHFAVTEGCGLSLRFAAGGPWQDLRPGHEPLCFDGAQAPDCRLLRQAPQGPHDHSTDLNLMTRGLRGLMQPMRAGEAMVLPTAQRGFFCRLPGRWRQGDGPAREVPAHTLVWADGGAGSQTGAWSFEPFGEPLSELLAQPQAQTRAPAGQHAHPQHGAPIGWWLGASPI